MAKAKTAAEIAQIIDRFLNGRSLYPQEWNDFIDCKHPDRKQDSFRKRCDELDPLVNGPEPQDANALAELRNIADVLRKLSVSG